MKKFIILALLLNSVLVESQEVTRPSVEEKFYGFQLGLLNSGFLYEAKLDRTITLRAEIGLAFGVTTREFDDPIIKDKTTTVFAPYIAVEPRWYYGLDRRNRLGKNIKNNSSNYVSVRTNFASYNTPVIKNGDLNIVPSVFLAPNYGIRRSFAKNFSYEFAGGYGLQYNIFSNKSGGCNCNHFTSDIDLKAVIAYNF